MSQESTMGSEPTTAGGGGFRLSPQQRRAWHLGRHRSPGRVLRAFDVEGELDAALLRRALAVVGGRHEILRTELRSFPGLTMPLQAVAPARVPEVEERDLQTLPVEDRAAAVDRLLAEARGEFLDGEGVADGGMAEAGPPLRVCLARLAPGHGLLVLSASPLHLDRAGLEALVRELVREAAPEDAAAAAGDDEEPMQYADLAEWQNGLLESDEAAVEAEAWGRLDLAEAARLRLPCERAADPAAPFAPAVVAVELDAAVAAGGEALTRRAGATLADLVLAAWRVLLGRLTGRDKLVLGITLEGREYEGLESLPGLLAKVVPLAVTVDGRRTPQELVRRAAEVVAEARASQEYWSWQAAGDGAQSEDGVPPCFPLGFELRREPAPLRLGGARLRPREEVSFVDPFTLHLVCRQAAGPEAAPPRLELAYDPRRIDPPDARRTLGQLTVLLRDLATGSPRTVADACVLSDEERRELEPGLGVASPGEPSAGEPSPGEPNARAAGSVAAPVSVPEQIRRQAALHPERPAVACGARVLRYGELAARVRRAGAALRRAGVAPEDRVAICFERSPELVVALLAVLEAGAAYVPLDPAQPRRRLDALLAASGARRVLAAPELAALFTDGPAEVLGLDGDAGDAGNDGDAGRGGNDDETGAAEESAAVQAPVTVHPESLAYLLFTSGSTGTPKAVAVEHRQLAAYVQAVGERIAWPPEGRFAIVSTFAADLGHTMVFPALCGGGCLDVVPAERISDPEAFSAYAGEHGIDCLKIVPSHLEALLTASAPDRVLPRRVLVLGGEALGWELAARVRTLAPKLAVYNHYGPTETTVGVLADPVPAPAEAAPGPSDPGPSAPGHPAPSDSGPGHRSATVPLGRPLAHARVHLLDAALQPVPTWAPGELYVGGAGVARGYLGQPGRTAERFVPDPSTPGGRLYRTGDLARRLPGGALEFLGRTDGQVKIRGFRVETGEVEALLRQHGGVGQAVVTARVDDGGEARLVAYVVPAAGKPVGVAEPVSPGELRAFLVERLPEAMVPTAFVSLAALPLNANGKVDRSALPAPDALRPELAADYVAPGTELEAAVAGIWQDVLRLERVGLHDNFFDLGGHSLLLVQVATRLRERCGRDVTMVELFRRTTVASLVAHLEDGSGGAAAAREAAQQAEAAGERGEGRRDALERQRELRRQRRTAGVR
ncbi:MAG TPA: amino acid adenylation domain-containing protein [Thermoanaerobaculia bacterium]|nr:amino acid adenylation domain-containing protein [Thermoanaerobaculia bacterium]